MDNLIKLFNWFPDIRKLFQSKNEIDFDDFLNKHFESCIQRMEAEAHHLSPDQEEKLSAFLAASLSIPGLTVIREGYSNGRVDLTIKLDSFARPYQRLAEAKIYKGHANHVDAINQLIERYSTGRQSVGYVIEYVKNPGISNIVLKLRQSADTDLPIRQVGLTYDHSMKWAYSSNHRHSSEDLIKVIHINVNLHR